MRKDLDPISDSDCEISEIFVRFDSIDVEGEREEMSLSRLWWRRFWYSCCIVGTSSHIARLHLSGNHLEICMWSLL